MFDKKSKEVQKYVQECVNNRVDEIVEKFLLFSHVYYPEEVEEYTGISHIRMQGVKQKCDVMLTYKNLMEKKSAESYIKYVYNVIYKKPDLARDIIIDICELDPVDDEDKKSIQQWIDDPIKCAIMEFHHYKIRYVHEICETLKIDEELYNEHCPTDEEEQDYQCICPCEDITYERMQEGYEQFWKFVEVYQAEIEKDADQSTKMCEARENHRKIMGFLRGCFSHKKTKDSDQSTQTDQDQKKNESGFRKWSQKIGSYDVFIDLVTDGILSKQNLTTYSEKSFQEMVFEVLEFETLLEIYRYVCREFIQKYNYIEEKK